MYYLNKLVWLFLNPMTATLLAMIAGLVIARWRRRLGLSLVIVALSCLWFASTICCAKLIGLPLEAPYRHLEDAAACPEADAIVVLGGGVSKYDGFVYPDLFDGADRVWHAARLFHAGKAPLIVVSGSNDLAAALPLLLDLGVPRTHIIVDNESRNTYENSRFTERLLLQSMPSKSAAEPPPRVLLVTSAWHMTRSLGNFSRTTLCAQPAPCDFKAHGFVASTKGYFDSLLPGAETLQWTSVFIKEWLGRLARR